jgi:hypothetical protein
MGETAERLRTESVLYPQGYHHPGSVVRLAFLAGLSATSSRFSLRRRETGGRRSCCPRPPMAALIAGGRCGTEQKATEGDRNGRGTKRQAVSDVE